MNVEEVLKQLQLNNQQLQNVMMQKQTYMLQEKEIEKSLEELDKCSDDDEIYHSIGPILVKSKKSDVKKDLEENKEDTGLRIKSLEKQEHKLKEKIKETQELFQQSTGRGEGG